MNGSIPKASGIVVDAIRKRILTERLPVDFRLPSEAELAEEFGLGRVSVREALRLLERDGLVAIKRGPGGGVLVRHPGPRQVSEAVALLFGMQNTTLREFIEFRLQLEPDAARMAAERATASQREEILAAAQAEREGKNDIDSIHALVAGATGNRVTGLVLNSVLQGHLVTHLREEKISNEDVVGSQKAHARIAEAVAAGDADAAERTMRVHLLAYRDYFEKVGLIDEPIVPVASSLAYS